MFRLGAPLAIAVTLLAGCVTAPKYDWGRYDPALYSYYKNPTKLGDLTATLKAIVDAADAKHARVPPGIYAEYGYLLLQQGQDQAAIGLFKQEATQWPESKVFMDHMIQVASIGPAGKPAQSPAP
jgi:hypothetical protein